MNGATLTTDRFGNQNGAYSFDGIDDYVGTNAIGPAGIRSRSYSFWIKTSSSLIQTPIDYYGLTGSAFQAILNSPCPGIGLDGAFGVVTRGGPTLINDEWHHCALVFDSLNDVTISDVDMFIDGILQTVIVCSAVNPNLIVNTIDPGAFVFGKTTSNVRFVNGKLDDIGIWNRALTQQEITNLYNSQLPPQTSVCLPTITTTSPSSVGTDSVVIGGNITNDGGSSIVLRGVCYSTSPNPNMGNSRTEDGSGIGSFNTVLRGLTSSTMYYACSYAKNSNGVVAYGNEVSFTTTASLPGVRCPGTPTVTDFDGNVYHTVQIGTQCWTQSNLRTSRYRNGDSIPTGLSNSAWTNALAGAYAVYENNLVNDSIYGKLYNHYAVTDSRGLCATGWRVPTDGDWLALETQLGGAFQAGGALKSTLTQPIQGGWVFPNAGATNSTGFSGMPGGAAQGSVGYDLTSNGFWWSTSLSAPNLGWMMNLSYPNPYMVRNTYPRNNGFSIRCLKNTHPQVNTTSVTNATPSTALVTGEVISDGGDQNPTRGFCYSTTSNPTITNDTTMNGTGLGVYSDTLLNLVPSTTYYVRAYVTNSVGTAYGNEENFTTSPLSVGSTYAGGIVFYLDSTGQHGLVCAPSGQGGFLWGCWGTNIVGTSTLIGTGQANTNLIKNGCSDRPIAASVCDNLVLNGYSDWYLPSLAELQLMGTNLHAQGMGGFISNSAYWSSSQLNSNYAWVLTFNVSGTSPGNYAKNSFANQVRAVRAF